MRLLVRTACALRFAHCVKRAIVLFVISLTIAATADAQYGSPYRKEYENETNGPKGECSDRFSKLRDGLEYRTIRCLGSSDLDMHVVRIDSKKWNINTHVVSGATASTVARDRNAAFALNANFFDASRRPLGAIVQSGDVVKSPRTSSWQSIFLLKEDGGARIILPSSWSSYRDRSWMAVQAGPRLVVDGHTAKVSQNYDAARAGVCIQKDGDLTFFATPQTRKFSMYEIARIARRAEIDGGLECKDAMLFDGGHSTNLFIEGGGERVSVNGDPVPVYVVATPRKE